MYAHPKLRKPFMFWLVQQLLPVDNKRMKNKVIGNKEFYSTMAIVAFALIVITVLSKMIK
jgi:hypothetical protein